MVLSYKVMNKNVTFVQDDINVKQSIILRQYLDLSL